MKPRKYKLKLRDLIIVHYLKKDRARAAAIIQAAWPTEHLHSNPVKKEKGE